MSGETRLARIVTDLQGVGLRCLVMGGHAVRYYGIDRTTLDFDLHLAPEGWDDLEARLAGTALFGGSAVVAGPTWRPHAFRRYAIGRLPDGREEWLEFWKSNHLLPPFEELHARREEGTYGGRTVPFLSLPDLIRSKETERNDDWLDVALLEETLDQRRIAQAQAEPAERATALAHVRSRRGFERMLQLGWYAARPDLDRACARAHGPIPAGFLLPFATPAGAAVPAAAGLEPIRQRRLQSATPGSTLHLSLVEVVRRQYKAAMQAADRADKEDIRRNPARD